jgi:uncharacterized protein (TIGR02246 family)
VIRALFMGLALAWLPAAYAQIPELEALQQRFIEAFRAGDLEGISRLFDPEASYTPIVGSARLNGRAQIRGYYEKVFAGSRSRDLTPAQVRWQLFGDVALRTADARIDQELVSGAKVATQARITFVYKREKDGWIIVHHHGSMVPPAPQAPKPPSQ